MIACRLTVTALALALTWGTVSARTKAYSEADMAPSARQVESTLLSDAIRFTVWYADPANPWDLTFNQAGGWTMVVFAAPIHGAPNPKVQYQIDGTQACDGTLPIFSINKAELFAYSPPFEDTPSMGRAPIQFWPDRLTVDVPLSALEVPATGLRYQVQVYGLVPLDEWLVRYDPAEAYPGIIGQSPLPVSKGPDVRSASNVGKVLVTWGVLRNMYR